MLIYLYIVRYMVCLIGSSDSLLVLLTTKLKHFDHIQKHYDGSGELKWFDFFDIVLG